MFASNFLADSLFYTFDNLLMTFKTIISDYPEEQQSKLFYENAVRIYRL
jgi:predicted TIM-barrel fold metal-dependent hydrolase